MVDIDEVREKWRALGFDCSLWTDPPGKVWEGYVHAVDELLMPVAGVLEIDMDGKTLRPAPGEEVFIPARTDHNVPSPSSACAGQMQRTSVIAMRCVRSSRRRR